MNRIKAVVSNRLFLASSAGAYMCIILLSFFIHDEMILQAALEFLLVLPGVLYLILKNQNAATYVGIKPVGIKQWGYILLIALCTDKITQFLNVLSQVFVPNRVSEQVTSLLLKYPFVVAFLVIAVLPAVCEEFTYRGVLYQGYRDNSKFLALILSSVLFGLMHMDGNQFCYAVATGLILALTNEAAGSFLPSVFIHFYINGKSTVLLYSVVNFFNGIRAQYLAAEMAGQAEKMAELVNTYKEFPIDQADGLTKYLFAESDVKLQLSLSAPLAIIAVVALVFLIRGLAKSSGRRDKLMEVFQPKKVSFLSPSLIIGCIICIGMMFV